MLSTQDHKPMPPRTASFGKQTSELEDRIQQQVGMKIRDLRKTMNLTSKEVAQRAALSQGQLSKIENGLATLSIKTLERICQALDRPMSYLFAPDDDLPRVLGTLISVEGPESEAIKLFARDLHERTNQLISLVPMWEIQLGSPEDQIDQLRLGIIDIFIDQLFHYGPYVPSCFGLSLPYLFTSPAHQREFYLSSFFQTEIRVPLLERGIRFINRQWNWLRGGEFVVASSRPIIEPRDIRGLRVRIYNSEILDKYWRSLGAIPVVIAWADINDALARKEVDILPTYKSHLYPLSFCRHLKFVTQLGDVPPVLGIGMSEIKYRLLSPSIQEKLHCVCDASGERFSQYVVAAEEKNERRNLEKFQAVYIRVNLEAWIRKSRQVQEDLVREGLISREFLDAVRGPVAG
jgi:C4-dicarboxylate-binding protein DctP